MFKIVVVCLISFVSNAIAQRVFRDVSHGYQYNPGYSSSGSLFLKAPSFPPTTSYLPAAPTGIGSKWNTGYGGLIVPGDTNEVNHFQQQAPIVTKHFYLHTAPEDHDENQIVKYINIGRPRQNYRVVFINTPSSNVARAKIIANVAPVEDKTAIYVLSKKTSDLDVTAEAVTPAPSEHKPEVYYIKYKTPQEAEHAQHVIQEQYDSLGGSSDFSNEGSIHSTSVIGALGSSGPEADWTSTNVIQIPGNNCDHCGSVVQTEQKQKTVNYLPPNQK